MNRWTQYCTGLVAAASLTPSLRAQVPAVPAVPATPAAAAAAAPTTAPQTLCSFLGLSKDQIAETKRKCCQTQFGQFLNNALKPVSIFTGGIFGNFCPTTPSAADLAKEGAEGAAARIQADEANAKARRAAVRYLGTVDCHYWGPEAEPALIAALRTDRNECVRWEAAMALGRGCCCTKKTIQALAITVSGSDKDGNPTEKSERVKGAATIALEHCLSCYHEITPAPPAEEAPAPKRLEPPPAKPVEPPTGTSMNRLSSGDSTILQVAVYYRDVDNNLSMRQVVENAQRILNDRGHSIVGGMPQHGSAGHSLFDIFMSANVSKVHAERMPVVRDVEPAMSTEARIVPVGASPPPVEVARVIPLEIVNKPSTPAVPGIPTPMTVPTHVAATALPPQVAPVAARVAAPAPLPTINPAPMQSVVIANAMPPVAQPSQALPSGNMSTQEMMTVLRNSFYPDQREWAATHLATTENKADPLVMQVLLVSAREDTAPIVRAACVRSLSTMGANTPAAHSVLQALKSDPDPRVRVAADKALQTLGAAQPTSAGSMTKVPVNTFVVPGPMK